MNPNYNSAGVIIPNREGSKMPITPKTKREERLEKGIKYFSSKMFLIQLILTIVFAIFEISFGREYYGQCPISPNIPLFLLVHGSTKVVWVACGIVAYIEAKSFPNSIHISILMLINLIIQILFMLFFLAWFIIGNVWFWSVKSTVQTTDSTQTSTYCQNSLYSATQGIIISTYIVFGVITLLTIKRRVIGQQLRVGMNQ
jgi:hypothetical protein